MRAIWIGLVITAGCSPPFDRPEQTATDIHVPVSQDAMTSELDELTGTWEIERAQLEDGRLEPRSVGVRWIFDRTYVTLVGTNGHKGRRPFETDVEKSPKTMDLLTVQNDQVMNRHLMIYSVEGDALTVAHLEDTSVRPTSFGNAIVLSFRKVPTRTSETEQTDERKPE